jgi:hypothetical protein
MSRLSLSLSGKGKDGGNRSNVVFMGSGFGPRGPPRNDAGGWLEWVGYLSSLSSPAAFRPPPARAA